MIEQKVRVKIGITGLWVTFSWGGAGNCDEG